MTRANARALRDIYITGFAIATVTLSEEGEGEGAIPVDVFVVQRWSYGLPSSFISNALLGTMS